MFNSFHRRSNTIQNGPYLFIVLCVVFVFFYSAVVCSSVAVIVRAGINLHELSHISYDS